MCYLICSGDRNLHKNLSINQQLMLYGMSLDKHNTAINTHITSVLQSALAQLFSDDSNQMTTMIKQSLKPDLGHRPNNKSGHAHVISQLYKQMALNPTSLTDAVTHISRDELKFSLNIDSSFMTNIFDVLFVQTIFSTIHTCSIA